MRLLFDLLALQQPMASDLRLVVSTQDHSGPPADCGLSQILQNPRKNKRRACKAPYRYEENGRHCRIMLETPEG